MKLKTRNGVEFEVDDEKVGEVTKHRWYPFVQRGVIKALRRFEGMKVVYLHRELMAAPENLCVQHRDGNPLNNKSSNLCLLSKSDVSHKRERAKGKSGIICVGNKWRARISKNRVRHSLGNFSSEKEARAAYKSAARILHGD
jgi:hypothetical protein